MRVEGLGCDLEDSGVMCRSRLIQGVGNKALGLGSDIGFIMGYLIRMDTLSVSYGQVL